MRTGFHRFPPEAFAVQKQFHLLAIAETPDADIPAYLVRPVPMRKQMQHRLVRPPGLVIIKEVFGETAHVHDAKVGIDARPAVRRRFTAIIETRPDKTA